MAAKTGTYTLISSTTLGSNTGTVTFSSIPATYTDLILVVNSGATQAVDVIMRFNNDSTSLYSYTILYGNGTSAASDRRSATTQIYLNWGSSLPTSISDNMIVSVQDYANSTTYKTSIARHNNAAGSADEIVGLWRNTSAINRIDLINAGSAGVFLSGSTFKLYGIEAGNL